MPTIAEIVTGAAQRYGVDPQAMLAAAQIESGLDPSARNPHSSAGGLFQFIDSTAGRYGLRNKFDAYESADAAGRLWRDNAASLRSALGHDPSGADLYLAHQQGAGGAAKILGNPNAPLASLVGGDAAGLNAGGGMTAGQFSQMWAGKLAAALGEGGGGGMLDTRPAVPTPAGLGAMFAEPLPNASPADVDPNSLAQLLSSFGRRPAQDDGKARAEAEQARRQALFAPV